MNGTSAILSTPRTSLRPAAISTGIASIVMAAAAMFAELFMRQRLIIPGDAATTAANVLANSTAFSLGLAGYALVLLCDVVVTWGFYILLRPMHKGIAATAAWLRLIYTVVFAVAVAQLVVGFNLLTSATDSSTVAEQAMQVFDSYAHIWAMGLVIFGPHLLLVGYLVWRSGRMPKVFGVLLLLAGLGYTIDNVAKLSLPNYQDFAAVLTMAVALPSIVGELGFAIWLLVRGGKGE